MLVRVDNSSSFMAKGYKGLTPVEVLVHSLCDSETTAKEVMKEVATLSKGDPKEEFNCCLEILKKRGLVAY